MPVRGIKRVKQNFRMKVQEIDGLRTNRAVYSVLSQGAAMSDTMTPIDTSNLINSRYSPQISHAKGKTSGHVGYTASYAAAVHEAPGILKGEPRDPNNPGRGDYWDPNAEPQFLAKGFEEIKSKIPAILKAAYARRI